MAHTLYNSDFRKKFPEEFEELIHIFRYEVQQSKRPASEVILVDRDVMKTLNIEIRTLQYLKSKRILPYSKIGGQSYYLLSDILALIERNRKEAIIDKIRIK